MVLLGSDQAVDGKQDFSFNCQFKSSAKTVQYLIQQREGGDGHVGQYVISLTSKGQVNFYTHGKDYHLQFHTEKAYNDGRLHHLTVTRKGQKGYIYINGELVQSSVDKHVTDINKHWQVALGGEGTIVPAAKNFGQARVIAVRNAECPY